MSKIRLLFSRQEFAYIDIDAPNFDPDASKKSIAGQIRKLQEEAMKRRDELVVFESENEFLPSGGWTIV